MGEGKGSPREGQWKEWEVGQWRKGSKMIHTYTCMYVYVCVFIKMFMLFIKIIMKSITHTLI